MQDPASAHLHVVYILQVYASHLQPKGFQDSSSVTPRVRKTL